MLCRYLPASGEHAASAPAGASQEHMRSGGVYDVSDAWRAKLCILTPGIDGGPCLVPVEPVVLVGERTVLTPTAPAKKAPRRRK